MWSDGNRGVSRKDGFPTASPESGWGGQLGCVHRHAELSEDRLANYGVAVKEYNFNVGREQINSASRPLGSVPLVSTIACVASGDAKASSEFDEVSIAPNHSGACNFVFCSILMGPSGEVVT